MSSQFASLLAIGLILSGLSSAEDSSGQEIWRNEAISFIERLRENPTQEDMRKLSTYAGIEYPGQAVSEFQSEVSKIAKKKLSQVPNHSECFEGILLELREKYNANEVYLDYNYERAMAFRRYAQVRSPQNVELLIRLLDDHLDNKQLAGGGVISGNDSFAESALIDLIENPPVPNTRFGPGTYKRDLSAWKKWGEQVQNGVRTFQFRGSPQRYNIHGPVETTTNRTPRRIERDVPKNDVPIAPSPKEVPWIPFGMAVAFLIGAGWWYARSSRRT